MRSYEYCRGADFCEEIAGDFDITFRRVYNGQPISRRIVEADSFIVVADLSPLTIGHLLILPRNHYLSFAEAMPYHFHELRGLLAWLLPKYRDTFGEPTILEHGSDSNFDHNACITHAHWHVVPVDGGEIHTIMLADGLPAIRLPTISDLSSPRINTAYFFLSYDDKQFAFRPTSRLRRQYLRSTISKPLNIPDPEWDYAVVVRKNYLRATVDRASKWI